MAEPFIGEIRMVGFSYAPIDWAKCDGQMFAVSQNPPLAALIGNKYGGDGTTQVALPDLRGRVPVHRGDEIFIGERRGFDALPLALSQMPTHLHSLNATPAEADASAPTGKMAADSQAMAFAPYGPVARDTPLVPLNPGSISLVGAGETHSNLQPSICVLFCIALKGLFPQRP